MSKTAIPPDRVGVYDQFSDDAKCLTFELSLAAGSMTDAHWSVIPGEIAIFYSHDGEALLCQVPRSRL